MSNFHFLANSATASLPTDLPSGLVKRSLGPYFQSSIHLTGRVIANHCSDTVTSPPDSHSPVTYNFSGPFGTQNPQASLTTSISEEEVISAEDPPFHRRGPAPKRGLSHVFSRFLSRKRMEEQPDIVGGSNALHKTVSTKLHD